MVCIPGDSGIDNLTEIASLAQGPPSLGYLAGWWRLSQSFYGYRSAEVLDDLALRHTHDLLINIRMGYTPGIEYKDDLSG